MINQREIPFVKIVIPLILGIIIGYHFTFPIHILLALLGINFMALGAIAFLKLSPKFRFFFSGLFYTFFFLLGLNTIESRILKTKINSEIVNIKSSFLVEILELPKYGNRINFNAKIIAIDSSQKIENNNYGELYVSLGKKDQIDQLQIGDRIFAFGTIRAIKPPKNKFTFNFKEYLKTQGIAHQLFVNDADWELNRKNQYFSITNLAHKIQQRFVKIIQDHIPSPSESSIVSALVLGSKSDLDPSIRTAYARTGSLHVLAVSGLHVGLIYAFLIFIFKQTTKPSKFIKWFKFSISILVIWAFTFISGAAPSVIRASTMLSLLLVAKNIQRYPNTYNIIAFAAFSMLTLNPFQLFNVSFQLSFLALLGIVFFHSRIYRSWYVKNWLGDKIWTLTALGISAQLGTFPIAIYYFHQFPIYFWLTGIFVVPFASLILALGLLLLFSNYLLPFLAPFIGKLLHFIVWLLNAMINLVQEIPNSHLSGIWINEFMVLLLYTIILIFAIAFGLKNKKILFTSLALLLGLLGYNRINILIQPPIDQLHIYQIYKNSRIDYLKGDIAYSQKNENIRELDDIKVSVPLHEALDINYTLDELPNRITNAQFDGIEYYLINNFKIGILTAAPTYQTNKILDLDLLVIENNPKLKISEILKIVNPERIIIDGSNPIWNVQTWKKDVQILNPDKKIFLTSEVGAITIDFENHTLKTISGISENL